MTDSSEKNEVSTAKRRTVDVKKSSTISIDQIRMHHRTNRRIGFGSMLQLPMVDPFVCCLEVDSVNDADHLAATSDRGGKST
jgi:hypothetical protein